MRVSARWVGAAIVGVRGLGQLAVAGDGGLEAAGGRLARGRGVPPGLADRHGGQPGQPAVVERDVGAAQQDRPRGLAGVFDDRLGRPCRGPDAALQSRGVGGEERADALASLAAAGLGAAVRAHRARPGLRRRGLTLEVVRVRVHGRRGRRSPRAAVTEPARAHPGGVDRGPRPAQCCGRPERAPAPRGRTRRAKGSRDERQRGPAAETAASGAAVCANRRRLRFSHHPSADPALRARFALRGGRVAATEHPDRRARAGDAAGGHGAELAPGRERAAASRAHLAPAVLPRRVPGLLADARRCRAGALAIRRKQQRVRACGLPTPQGPVAWNAAASARFP
jgi:hypothetical protein